MTTHSPGLVHVLQWMWRGIINTFSPIKIKYLIHMKWFRSLWFFELWICTSFFINVLAILFYYLVKHCDSYISVCKNIDWKQDVRKVSISCSVYNTCYEVIISIIKEINVLFFRISAPEFGFIFLWLCVV